MTPKNSWALSKAEKKQYDQIFRAWDAQGTGFINGQTALEVFGQSSLERNDLARIWSVSTFATGILVVFIDVLQDAGRYR